MDVKELQSRIEGTVTVATDAGYEESPARSHLESTDAGALPASGGPGARTEQDVVEAIRFARAQ